MSSSGSITGLADRDEAVHVIYLFFFLRRTYDTGLQDVLIINWRTSLGDTPLRELQNWLRENVPDASACTGSYPGSITHLQRNRRCNCCI